MIMKFSIVMPIHNEAEMLLKTLLSILQLHPDEIIVGLDQCSDEGEDIIYEYVKRHRPASLRCLSFKRYNGEDGRGWNFRAAYLRRDLYRLAENDVILNTSADLVLDPVILKYLSLVPECGLVSFGYLEMPWNIQCFLRAIYSASRLVHGFAGLLAFSKEAWLRSEDLEHLKTINRSEDTHLHMAMMKHYQTMYFNTRSIHLRPNEGFRGHYLRGVSQYELGVWGLWRAFMWSLFMARPASFVGYWQRREIDRQGEKVK